MTAVHNYATLINRIFGSGTATFPITDLHSNNVIGALNNTEFNIFTTNFIARLERLKSLYSTEPLMLAEIIVQVNEIQSKKNWEGAFAELATYDHMNFNAQNFFSEPITPNITLPANASLAKILGKQATNLDGHIPDLNLYFDVKCFKDNVNEILDNIFRDFKTQKHISNLGYIAEHAMDTSYDEYKNKRSKLLQELKSNIDPLKKPRSFTSKVIQNLTFRLIWDPGVNTGLKTYDSYEHAKNFHKSIFNYANKFMLNKPSFIVLVVFPWYNQILNPYDNRNIDFYRSLSRRFFCQYKHSRKKLSEFSVYSGNKSLKEISKYLSGIIILEDNSILADTPSQTNCNSYVFLNPNAKNKIIDSMALRYLHHTANVRFDDFENDNY